MAFYHGRVLARYTSDPQIHPGLHPATIHPNQGSTKDQSRINREFTMDGSQPRIGLETRRRRARHSTSWRPALIRLALPPIPPCPHVPWFAYPVLPLPCNWLYLRS